MKLMYSVFIGAGFVFQSKLDRYVHLDSNIAILLKDNRYYNIHGTEYTTLAELIDYMLEETENNLKEY